MLLLSHLMTEQPMVAEECYHRPVELTADFCNMNSSYEVYMSMLTESWMT